MSLSNIDFVKLKTNDPKELKSYKQVKHIK